MRDSAAVGWQWQGCTVLLGDVGVADGAPEMEAGGNKPQ